MADFYGHYSPRDLHFLSPLNKTKPTQELQCSPCMLGGDIEPKYLFDSGNGQTAIYSLGPAVDDDKWLALYKAQRGTEAVWLRKGLRGCKYFYNSGSTDKALMDRCFTWYVVKNQNLVHEHISTPKPESRLASGFAFCRHFGWFVGVAADRYGSDIRIGTWPARSA